MRNLTAPRAVDSINNTLINQEGGTLPSLEAKSTLSLQLQEFTGAVLFSLVGSFNEEFGLYYLSISASYVTMTRRLPILCPFPVMNVLSG